MEELLDERAMGVFIVRGEFRDIARARKFDYFSVVGQIFGKRVDGFAVVDVAEFSDGVEMFEAEAKRIDEGMTALAISIFGQLRDFFAHRQRWIEFSIVKS